MKFYTPDLTLVLALLLLAGCGPTNSDDDNDTTDSTDSSNCTTFETSEEINDALTLDANCYQIEGILTVDAGDLSLGSQTTLYLSADSSLLIATSMIIAPGATLIFDRDTSLNIDGGTLIADASDEGDDPIRFIGAREISGYWQGLRFANTPTTTNRLANVQVSHAGSVLWERTSALTQNNIFIDQGGRLDLNNADITDAAHHGISVVGDGQLQGCDDLRFFNIERHHVYSDEMAQSCM